MAYFTPPQDHKDFKEVNKLLAFPNAGDAEIQMVVHRCCADVVEHDVLQLSYKLLTTIGSSHPPRVQFIQEAAPSKPNTFSDGSLQFPWASLSYATFGTWERYRDLAQFQPEEMDYSRPIEIFNVRRNGGILQAGVLPGVFNSSTRAELAGVISSLPKPIGLHVALDNRGVVDRANAILNGTFRHRRPWALMDDGDLWQLFEDAITVRGPHSLAFSWTKGHASWSNILANSTNEHAVGNGQADLAADRAFDACEKGDSHSVLKFHALKQQAYQKLISRLQGFASKLILRDKFLRQEAGFQDQGSRAPPVIIEAPPLTSRRCFTEGSGLNLMPLPPSLVPTHATLHLFWNSLRWISDEQAKPTTWLELFALYRLMGGG